MCRCYGDRIEVWLIHLKSSFNKGWFIQLSDYNYRLSDYKLSDYVQTFRLHDRKPISIKYMAFKLITYEQRVVFTIRARILPAFSGWINLDVDISFSCISYSTQLHVSGHNNVIVFNAFAISHIGKKTFFLTTMGPWNSMFSQYFVILFRIFIDRLPSNFFEGKRKNVETIL